MAGISFDNVHVLHITYKYTNITFMMIGSKKAKPSKLLSTGQDLTPDIRRASPLIKRTTYCGLLALPALVGMDIDSVP
jgi:hypothetical protein